MTGVINLYKPKGITSSDAVVKVKKILHTRAVGHMGTLDPQGEGVLILGVGKATRLFNHFLAKDKVYEAEFTFGQERDTLDGEGEIIASGGRVPACDEIKSAMTTFVGKQMQVPPLYSAKKIAGRKAYDIARSGETILLKACEVEIFAFDFINLCDAKLTVRVHCSSGTYVRSLCRDLAHKLDTYAYMTAIKRIRCGSFDIAESVTLDELTSQKLLSVQQALPELIRYDVQDELYSKLCNGVKLPTTLQGKALVFCKGEMFGIGEAADGFLSITTYMREV